MNAEQSRIADEMDRVNAELEGVLSMKAESETEQREQLAQTERLTAELETLTARAKIQANAAEARAKAAAVRPATNSAGVVVPVPAATAPAPAARSMVHVGKVAGYDRIEDAVSAGTYLRSLARGEIRGAFTGADEIANSMGGKSPTYDGKGSELVNYELYRGILNLLSYSSVCAQVASTFAVNQAGMFVPVQEDAEEAEIYRENCEIAAKNVGTTNAILDLHKIGARVQVSNELIEDAVASVAGLVTQTVSYRFARKIDKTWLQGDAAAGVVGLISGIPAGNQITAPAKLDAATLADMVGVVNPNARNRAWVVSPAGWGKIMSVAATAIGASIAEGVRPMVYGAPVFQCLELPDNILALYGDFGAASALGYKPAGLTIRASQDRAIEYDQTVFVATARYGWANHSPSYVSALKKAS